MQTKTLTSRTDEQLSQQPHEDVHAETQAVTSKSMAMLSEALAADHLTFNQELEGSLKDGLK